MKKPAKIIVASTLGAALLLGGSTYALWTSSANSELNSTIQIGNSDLTKLDGGVWVDELRTAASTDGPVVIADIGAFRAAPGDTVSYEQSYRLDISGNAATTVFAVTFEDDAAVGVEALAARGFTLTTTILDANGDVVATSAGKDGLGADFQLEGATPEAGSTYTVRFEYKIDSSVSAEDTKKMQTVISNAVVSANQVS